MAVCDDDDLTSSVNERHGNKNKCDDDLVSSAQQIDTEHVDVVLNAAYIRVKEVRYHAGEVE
jgi:hypothetical protein